ncbi:MAG: SRPBCC domain-containing protein [Acidimicrobiales bacterium]
MEADPEVVYRHLVDPAELAEWIALGGALSDPVEGGALRWSFANGAVMSGRYLELDPPRRIVFTYGWEDDLRGVPPGATIVEIDLEPHPRGTRLRLTHRLLPDHAAEDHRLGWDHFLAVLAHRLARP